MVTYFTKVLLKVQPKPIPAKLSQKIVAVVAEGDYVVVITPRIMNDPQDPKKSYSTSWFDMWRFTTARPMSIGTARSRQARPQRLARRTGRLSLPSRADRHRPASSRLPLMPQTLGDRE